MREENLDPYVDLPDRDDSSSSASTGDDPDFDRPPSPQAGRLENVDSSVPGPRRIDVDTTTTPPPGVQTFAQKRRSRGRASPLRARLPHLGFGPSSPERLCQGKQGPRTTPAAPEPPAAPPARPRPPGPPATCQRDTRQRPPVMTNPSNLPVRENCFCLTPPPGTSLDDLIDAVEETAGDDSVLVLQHMGGSKFLVCTRNANQPTRLMVAEGFKVHREHVAVEAVSPPVTFVNIYRFPAYLPDDVLVNALGQYGNVKVSPSQLFQTGKIN
ncbi:hypothetical protein HPB52_006467 [Rhipicephalus sanguineus]|uniref:Uncharacterized protein n=1 Tax=Rhipicephalus sanguineus TaxID=34632 RepID=A0A9D4PD20_RHISA|nr:hypothetical protein HPB52_006467 [Rhipicephalus sanguineus]